MPGQPSAAPPAYHRHILITPGPGEVSAWVEDDYHHMGVTLHHDGAAITGVEPGMVRAPWTTCPGAAAQLRQTFLGADLSAAVAYGEKKQNCTHLHDMAGLAAAHAQDTVPTRYRIIATDPAEGVRVLSISRNGEPALRLVERDGRIEQPAAIAGKTLFELGEWIAGLEPPEQEAARLLRWGAIIAHGRMIPMERQSDASRLPPNCYTFQPERKHAAKRVGEVIDFTRAPRQPLAGQEA